MTSAGVVGKIAQKRWVGEFLEVYHIFKSQLSPLGLSEMYTDKVLIFEPIGEQHVTDKGTVGTHKAV